MIGFLPLAAALALGVVALVCLGGMALMIGLAIDEDDPDALWAALFFLALFALAGAASAELIGGGW